MKGKEARTQAIDIPRKSPENETFHKMFVDPHGIHVLICTKQGETYYICPIAKKLKKCDKLKGLVFESVGWDKETVSDSTTGNVLMGTNNGAVYEVRFDVTIKDGVKSAKLVYDLKTNASDQSPVTGLEVEYFVPPRASNFTVPKFFILVTTPSR